MASLKQFNDVSEILEAAAKAGGGSYTLETAGKATHWVQRAYTYRKMLQKASVLGVSPYDEFQFKKRGNVIHIERLVPTGTFTPAKVPDEKLQRLVPTETRDELDIAAEAFASTLGIDPDER